MAYERISFTKRSIEGLSGPEAGNTAIFYMDDSKGAPSGFGLWVTAGGAKSFMLYRKVKGRPERIKLGRFPDMTLEQARTKATKINGQIAEGHNPAERARAAKGEPTLGELFKDYIERHAVPHGVKTIDDMKANWARYMGELKKEPRKKHGREKSKPSGAVNWDNRRPSTLNRDEVDALHKALAKGCGDYTANRAIQLLRAVLNWGIQNRVVDRQRLEGGENPAAGIELFKEYDRKRFVQPDEMPNFFKSLAEEPSELLRDFVLIGLLTGVRKTNVLEMKWEQVNLDRGTWEIPDTKNDEALTVPLTRETVMLLRKRDRAGRDKNTGERTSEYVFPSDSKSGHLASPNKGWKRIRVRAGMVNVRIHDLRRSLGSWMAAAGASLPIIGKGLGHKDLSTTAIYARLNQDPVRKYMEKATGKMFSAGNLPAKSKVSNMRKPPVGNH